MQINYSSNNLIERENLKHPVTEQKNKEKNKPIRFGVIDYFVTQPVTGWLAEEKKIQKKYGIEVYRGVLTEINSALLQGKIDIANVSSVAFGNNCDKWLLLPNLSVSSSGPVRSVLLFSYHEDWKKLDRCTIAITNQSETSVALLKSLCYERYQIKPKFIVAESNLDAMLEKNSAALIIGDQALKEWALKRTVHGKKPYIFDLGEEWDSWMGYPFVYSVWAVRKEAASQVLDSPLLSLLRKSKKHGHTSLKKLAKSEKKKTNLPQALCEDYLKGMSYDLSLSHLRGLRFFLELSVKNFHWRDIKFITTPADNWKNLYMRNDL